MMNVEQITSRLAQMPDQALQKYAMMNKDDPYIMALALSESRRRKQMRMAQQAAPVEEQPKVADQALMEMGMGVDALPTEDMDFAGGGIVAFSGDEFENDEETGQLVSEEDMAELGGEGLGAIAPPAYQPIAYTAPAAPAGLAATPQAAAAAKKPAAPGPVVPSVQGAKEIADQLYDVKAQTAPLEEYQKRVVERINTRRAEREKGKPTGKAFSRFEELLQQEAAKEPKEKEDAFNVALFRFGLEAMAGRSPFAFENIGKAGGAALTEYSGAVKDMKRAAKERQKAMAEIEQARRAEARQDWKAKQDWEEKAAASTERAELFGVRGITAATGKSAELSTAIYNRQVANADAERRAKEALARRPRDLKGELADALLKGDEKRAAALRQAISASGGGDAGAGIENAKTRARRQEMLELQAIMKDEAMIHSDDDKKWASKRYAELARQNAKESGANPAQSGEVDKKNPLLN